MMMNTRSSIDRSPKRIRVVDSQIDRLSDLPKPITHHIMSYLPNKDTIRVGVLSKHFLSVWRSFPVIEFDNFDTTPTQPRPRRGALPAARFASHVRNSLRRREALETDLERFHFRCYGFDGQWKVARELVEEMGSYALGNNVRDLSLNFVNSFVPGFPVAGFSSTSVRKMALSGMALGPGDLDLACPNLEDFTIHYSSAGNVVTLSSPKLKTANLNLCEGPAYSTIRIRESSRSLESFSYSGGVNRERCVIENLSECRALKHLGFEHLQIDGDWFHSQVARLPSLLNLRLGYCRGPSGIIIRNNSVHFLSIRDCAEIETVHVESKNLMLFRMWSMMNDTHCKTINIGECTGLRDIHIRGASACVTSQWVEATVSRMEHLLKMVISHCNKLDRFWISAPRLQGLELIQCKDLRSFDIDAPNLVWFVLDGRLDYLPPSLVQSTKLSAEIRFHNFNRNDFYNLRDFLTNFAHCKVLTISNYRDERLIFPARVRSELVSPLIDLKKLIVGITVQTFPTFNLIESSLWLAPRLSILSININGKPYVTLRFLYNPRNVINHNSNNNGDGLACCIISPFKCWRHTVAEIEIETFPGFKEPWDAVQLFFVSQVKSVIVRRVMNIMM